MASSNPQDSIDLKIRLRAFAWLEEQSQIYGETLSRKLLEKGMIFEGVQVPLVGPQGIWKPKVVPEIPLTITTSPESPYEDEYSSDQYLLYKYRGTDPEHRDNKGLRLAMINRAPLIYFFGIVPGKYLPVWPVYIVGDDPTNLTFKVAVDEKMSEQLVATLRETKSVREPSEEDPKRRYLTVQAKYRLHQQQFRERVLRAYQEQCAMCRLKHPELLEAVHIIPDSEPKGDPVITNGISLCNFHHAAFDRFILGITPDYVINVREDILREKNGPMLLHGLQNLNNQKIQLPALEKNYPDPEKLEIRYHKFSNFAA